MGQGPGQAPGGGVLPGPAAGAVSINQNGVVNAANFTTSIAPGSVVSIYGQNLAEPAKAEGPALPTLLGGACVTLDGAPLPVFLTSPEQINVQIPPATAAGARSLVVRNINRHLTSPAYRLTVQKYAPAVFVNEGTGLAAVYHADGSPVTLKSKARRDEPLTLFATGLGATKGATVTAGRPSPEAAVTEAVQVFFGDPRMKQSQMIVDWSGLAPGLIGVYRIDLRVPGFHEKGDALPVTLRIGNVDSPTTGQVAPRIAVE
jgi:uncharacterized protein (TIGR03437 family)